MLKTGLVVRYLKKENNPIGFETIWKNVKDEVISTLGKEIDEVRVKSDLLISLIEDERIISLGSGKWDLRERYSLEDVVAIDRKASTEELDITLETTEDTRELKIGLLDDDLEDTVELGEAENEG